jgi:hypothetical protein
MAYVPRSSFIPKETSGAIPLQVRRKRTIHVFKLITMLVFTASIAGTAGLFFYKDYADKELIQKKETLSAKIDDTESKIEQIRIYNTKLSTARALLDAHLAPSGIFEELEDSTKQTVQFEAFEYTYDPGYDATLTLGGKTNDLTSVALQKAQYFEDGTFTDFRVDGITKSAEIEEDGSDSEVVFNVTGRLKKRMFNFEGILDEAVPANPLDAETDESGTAIQESEIITP